MREAPSLLRRSRIALRNLNVLLARLERNREMRVQGEFVDCKEDRQWLAQRKANPLASSGARVKTSQAVRLAKPAAKADSGARLQHPPKTRPLVKRRQFARRRAQAKLRQRPSVVQDARPAPQHVEQRVHRLAQQRSARRRRVVKRGARRAAPLGRARARPARRGPAPRGRAQRARVRVGERLPAGLHHRGAAVAS